MAGKKQLGSFSKFFSVLDDNIGKPLYHKREDTWSHLVKRLPDSTELVNKVFYRVQDLKDAACEPS